MLFLCTLNGAQHKQNKINALFVIVADSSYSLLRVNVSTKVFHIVLFIAMPP